MSEPIYLGIRPEHFFIDKRGQAANQLSGKVTLVEPLGGETLVHVNLGHQAIQVKLDGGERFEFGQDICLGVELGNCTFFDKYEGEKN